MSIDLTVQIVLALIPAIFTLIVGYFLGLRSQKQQTLHEYVTSIVKKEYPGMFADIRLNSNLLDKWLNESYEQFDFHNVEAFFDNGLDSLMEKHHPDLYTSMRELHNELVPKLNELHKLQVALYTGLKKTWDHYLNENLPEDFKKHSNLLVGDLIGSINKFNVLADLLVGDKAAITEKLQDCVVRWEYDSKKTTDEYRLILKKRVNVENTVEGLVESAEPSVKEVVLLYQKLQTRNNNLLKKSLLPLIQKYIAQPV